MERYICIHGHFYQPPRENPWLEAVELQDSAYPFHDWNERLTAECYAANAAARIMGDDQRVARIVNNYARISFNFGPTLLAWLEAQQPEVYGAILAADEESMRLFSGHGSAIAQAYNHIIMPLASRQDKMTQVYWGIRDFEHRFKRRPRGMWLPETAVDLETLEVLSEQGIDYTILAPYQAHRFRKIGDPEWTDVLGGYIDPTRAYVQRLPSGRLINLFFYDGPISRGIAFEKVLSSGENFANRLAGAFDDGRDWDQLVHIATDGETYGHHHRHGDMALAYALDYIEQNQIARLTNYSEYLERHPPVHEVEIVENTAWSCAHGIGRWQNNCGCNSGGYPHWNQEWRAPLRAALDWLRDEIAPHYKKAAKKLLRDPWAARDHYVDVMLDRSPASIDQFFAQYGAGELNENARSQALKLLEIQRHALLMYTSCGWFFDELSGIETVQVIQYAGRVVQLAQEWIPGLEERFLGMLEQAKSNIPEHQDGRHIYEKWVKPAMVDLEKVGAHYAMSEIFEHYPAQTEIYCYDVEREDYTRIKTGISVLVAGRAKIRSQITGEAQHLTFASLYFNNHNLTGGVQAGEDDDTYQSFKSQIVQAFEGADIAATFRLMGEYFVGHMYSLDLLFRDQQRKILEIILQSTNEEAESVYRQFYRHNAPLLRYFTSLRVPLAATLRSAAEFTVNANLRKALLDDEINLTLIDSLLDEGNALGVQLDSSGLSFQLTQRLNSVADDFMADPLNLSALQHFETLAKLVRALPFEVIIWKPQNVYYQVGQSHYAHQKAAAERGDDAVALWVSHFDALGDHLSMSLSD